MITSGHFVFYPLKLYLLFCTTSNNPLLSLAPMAADTETTLHRRPNDFLIAIGGTIGTGLVITIRTGLAGGGPGSLFVAFVLFSLLMACVNHW